MKVKREGGFYGKELLEGSKYLILCLFFTSFFWNFCHTSSFISLRSTNLAIYLSLFVVYIYLSTYTYIYMYVYDIFLINILFKEKTINMVIWESNYLLQDFLFIYLSICFISIYSAIYLLLYLSLYIYIAYFHLSNLSKKESICRKGLSFQMDDKHRTWDKW